MSIQRNSKIYTRQCCGTVLPLSVVMVTLPVHSLFPVDSDPSFSSTTKSVWHDSLGGEGSHATCPQPHSPRSSTRSSPAWWLIVQFGLPLFENVRFGQLLTLYGLRLIKSQIFESKLSACWLEHVTAACSYYSVLLFHFNFVIYVLPVRKCHYINK